MGPLKVIQVAPRYFPAISGAEFYVQRVSEVLTKLGDCVRVKCSNARDFGGLKIPNRRSLPAGEELVGNVPVSRFRVAPPRAGGNEIVEFVKNAAKLPDEFTLAAKSLLSRGPHCPGLVESLRDAADAFHSTCLPYFSVVQALAGREEAVSACTPFTHVANPRYSNPDYYRVLGHYDLIFSCTPTETDFLCRAGVSRKKIRQITMGVDLNPFAVAQASWFDRVHPLGTRPVVLFCGYKNYEKGALTLLRAAPLVAGEFPDVAFVFIGPSTTAFNLETRKVKRAGFRNIVNIHPSNLNGYFDPIKLGAFKRCDVFAMPSRSDAYGIAFLEAWAAGKPVVGARAGATPDVVDESVDGVLVPFGDEEELALQLVKLIGNPTLREEMGRLGLQKVVERGLTWENITDTFRKRLEEELACRR
ncbi:MAG: glycosyltransferase family 4 protein [Promethearchaeota archaeon]